LWTHRIRKGFQATMEVMNCEGFPCAGVQAGALPHRCTLESA